MIECKGCQGFRGHNAYDETLGELVYHPCEVCEGTGEVAPTLMTVAQLKELALSYYELGGDRMVECWEDSELQEFINEEGANAEKEALDLFANWHDYAEGIRNTAY